MVIRQVMGRTALVVKCLLVELEPHAFQLRSVPLRLGILNTLRR